MNVFDEILTKAEKMSLEDQTMIIDILRSRCIDKRREEILRNAKESLEEYRKGTVSKGSVEDLLQEL
ncbi:MAG: hypothetical protein WC749_06645 [Dehalococcoidia bacterium]